MGLLKTKIINKIKKEIAAQFPEMRDIEPHEERIIIETDKDVLKKLDISLPKIMVEEEIFKLSFKQSTTTEDGFELQTIVRVLVTKQGKILKLSTTK